MKYIIIVECNLQRATGTKAKAKESQNDILLRILKTA